MPRVEYRWEALPGPFGDGDGVAMASGPTPSTIGEATDAAVNLLLPHGDGRLCRRSAGSMVRTPWEEARLVKTMTCKQLGGPCDLALRGNTADEVIKAQDSHLRTTVGSGDESHKDALKDMKGRWRHPWSGMAWYRNTKREFAALPED